MPDAPLAPRMPAARASRSTLPLGPRQVARPDQPGGCPDRSGAAPPARRAKASWHRINRAGIRALLWVDAPAACPAGRPHRRCRGRCSCQSSTTQPADAQRLPAGPASARTDWASCRGSGLCSACRRRSGVNGANRLHQAEGPPSAGEAASCTPAGRWQRVRRRPSLPQPIEASGAGAQPCLASGLWGRPAAPHGRTLWYGSSVDAG